MKDALSVRLRFGPFELNPRSGELCNRNGRQVLQDQPLLILRMLIEAGGELVSREEIKNKLWPNDTIVEFDHSIHAAISNLRKALDDSAAESKYIETIPRRGYRLMVPVEWLGTDESCGDISEAGDSGVVQSPLLPKLIGKKVSHYRVLEVLGGGGMGMLYKAEDLKLGRQVALKFLPEELAGDPVALQRFEREARTASSLNHPNICTIHEVEEYEGQPFIVMELLEGETLRDRLATLNAGQKRLSLHEVLNIAIQMCDGLETAHRKGIIHRDIKPANIFLTRSDQLKILDFGLAKQVVGDKAAALSLPAEAPTQSQFLSSVIISEDRSAQSKDPFDHGALKGVAPLPVSNSVPFARAGTQNIGDATLTRTGLAMGTAGYMSPEQVRGEKLDARTDIFSLGLVLYEMGTGQRAFTAETAAAVHDAIVSRNPVPIRDLNSSLPLKLEAVIGKALEKDPARRYQSVATIRGDLEQINARPLLHLPATWRWYAAASMIVAIVMVAWLYRRSRTPLKLTDKDTIVLAHVTQSTGDTVMDHALDWPLLRELTESPYLNVLYASKVVDTLRLLKVSNISGVYAPQGPELTPELAREVCLQSDSKAFVTASISNIGNYYDITLNALDCHSGKTLAAVRKQTNDRNQIVKTLGLAGLQLRRDLGEPEESLRRFNTPLEQETSWSLEALQAHSQAWRLRAEQGDAAALPQYKRAVELDPNLANAYLNIAAIYLDSGDNALMMTYANRAFNLRERLSQRSGRYIEATYYTMTGELDKANDTYIQWLQTFPADPALHQNFSSCLTLLGQHERAAVEGREAVRLTPKRETYSNFSQPLIYMNRLEEAKAVLEEARARGIDHLRLRSQRYQVAFLQGDTAGMQEQLSWAMAKPETKEWALQQQGDTATHDGRFRAALGFYSKMPSYSSSSAAVLADNALRDIEAGNPFRAKQAAEKALAAGPSSAVRRRLAMVFARAGAVNQADTLAEAINRESPLDTLVQKCELPTIRAAIELSKNEPARAIEILQSAVPYDLAVFPLKSFPGLYPAYLRGLAYLKLGKGPAAAAEFQKMIDHPGIPQDFITLPLSHLQLARAQAMMGDKAAARKSYQDFLALWKDADPDIPIYRQAKAEYARLH